MKVKTNNKIKRKLRTIAKMLDREYIEEPKKSIRAIYRAVAELNNEISTMEKLEWS